MTTWRQLTGDELEHGYICESSSHADDDKHFAAWISSDEGAFMCADCYQKANPQEPMERPTCETCFYWDGDYTAAVGHCMYEPLPQIDSNGFYVFGKTGKHQYCSKHPDFPRWIEQQGEK